MELDVARIEEYARQKYPKTFKDKTMTINKAIIKGFIKLFRVIFLKIKFNKIIGKSVNDIIDEFPNIKKLIAFKEMC